MSFVYFALCLISCKGYVGKVDALGKTVKDRWQQHVKGSGNAIFLLRAIKKYGSENFQVSTIESNLTPEQAAEMEKFWIKRLGTFGHGYNLTEGGDGVSWWKGKKRPPYSPEARYKMGSGFRGKKRPQFSKEWRKKLGHDVSQRERDISSKRLSETLNRLWKTPEWRLRAEEWQSKAGQKGGQIGGHKGQRIGGPKSRHVRWHKNRGIIKSECEFCKFGVTVPLSSNT